MPEKDRNRKSTKPAIVRERRITAAEYDIRRRSRERVRIRLAIAALLFVVVLLAALAFTHPGR